MIAGDGGARERIGLFFPGHESKRFPEDPHRPDFPRRQPELGEIAASRRGLGVELRWRKRARLNHVHALSGWIAKAGTVEYFVAKLQVLELDAELFQLI